MRFAVGCALMLTLGAGSVRAAEPSASDGCRGPSIVLDPPLSHRRSWRAAAGDTRKRVAELSDVDACTELEVEQADGAVHVRASAADGRSVVRELSGPAELEPTVVALLVLPPADRTEDFATSTDGSEHAASVVAASAAKPDQEHAAALPPKPSATPASAPTPASARDHRDDPARLGGASAGAGTHGFEVALAGSGRAAGYLLGAGASTLVDWRFGGWLVGATAHAEQATGPSNVAGRFSAVRSASLGALFGRRLIARPFYLDAAVELPIVTVSTSEWTSTQTVTTPVPGETEPGEVGEDSGDSSSTTSSTRTSNQATPPSVDLRAGGLLRGVVPFAGRFGAMLAADAEHSLGILRMPQVSGQPAPLGWNFGVSLGLFWSTR
jgi:hypothetical protein